VRRFAEAQAYRGEAPKGRLGGEPSRDADDIEASLWAAIRRLGWAAGFVSLEKQIAAWHAEREANNHQPIGISDVAMQELADKHGLQLTEVFYG
jgi:hypothetical protein